MNQIGRVFDTENENTIMEMISPPMPIIADFYRCDKRFHHAHILMPLYHDYETYGIALIAGEDSELYNISGTTTKQVGTLGIYRNKRMKNGGMSSNRFLHIRQSQIADYVKKLALQMNQTWIVDSVPQVKGIILAGMAEIKDEVWHSSFLDPKLAQIIRKSIRCTQQSLTLDSVLSQCQDIIGSCDIIEETKNMSNLLAMLNKPDMHDYQYGYKEIEEALKQNLVSHIYLHQGMEDQAQFLRLQNLAREAVAQQNIKFTVFSLVNSTGAQFLSNLGGAVFTLWKNAHLIINQLISSDFIEKEEENEQETE